MIQLFQQILDRSKKLEKKLAIPSFPAKNKKHKEALRICTTTLISEIGGGIIVSSISMASKNPKVFFTAIGLFGTSALLNGIIKPQKVATLPANKAIKPPRHTNASS